jgi:hypothetical protein
MIFGFLLSKYTEKHETAKGLSQLNRTFNFVMPNER